MNKEIIVIVFEILTGLFIITQVVVPAFSNLPYFWAFKRTTKNIGEKPKVEKPEEEKSI